MELFMWEIDFSYFSFDRQTTCILKTRWKLHTIHINFPTLSATITHVLLNDLLPFVKCFFEAYPLAAEDTAYFLAITTTRAEASPLHPCS